MDVKPPPARNMPPPDPAQTPLKAVRLRLGQSIHRVAKAVHTSPGNLSRLENGKQKASPELAARLAEFFGSEITEIQILYPERFGGRSAR